MPPFSRIIAQTEVKRRANEWLEDGRGQAVLLSGETGSGKKTFARCLAQTLLCESRGADGACGNCSPCRYMESGSHPDFHELLIPKGEKQIKVADLREQVLADVAIRPQIGALKVYLIEADGLNEQGQNALLKTLEEPPDYARFVLTASLERRLLPTIRSRLLPLRFRPLDEDEMARILRMHGLPVTQAPVLTFLTNGSAGRAIEYLSSTWFLELSQGIWDFFMKLPGRPLHVLLGEDYRYFESQKDRWPEILDLMQGYLRDLLLIVRDASKQRLMNRALEREMRELCGRAGLRSDGLWRLSTVCRDACRDLAININFEMSVCTILLQFSEEFNHA